MHEHANVVIVGAGIVGCSAAYHLSKLGWRDIVVVDQGPLFETGGSTSHAPGLIFQTNPSRMMTEMARYTVSLLSELEHEGQPCFYPVGGIEVAYTEARHQDLKRRHGFATAYGLKAHLISPSDVKTMIPILDERVIKSGYYVPSDGDTRGWQAAASLAAHAAAGGEATFYGETTVTGILIEGGRVRGVATDKGEITAEHVLLCTNIWGPVLGAKAGLKLPLLAVEHQYLVSEPLAELAGETRFINHPILRHQDFAMYFRQHADAYGVGSYKHEPLLVEPQELGKTAMRPFTPRDFGAAKAAAEELLPLLRRAEYAHSFNGMFAFTVDGYPIIGESHVRGLWTAIGIWVTHSGGAGKAVAELMTHGYSELDLREADINRFHPHAGTPRYVRACCAQQYREVYDIIHPLQQMEESRPLRLSPFHTRLAEQGGVFYESAGWELAQWYEANATLVDRYRDRVPAREGWAARYWSPIEGAEHLAVRDAAGLFNISAFTKIAVSGPGALAYLEWLSANRIDRPTGTIIYTALLNIAGGIKADLTMTRTGEDSFLVLTGGTTGPQDLAWLKRHAPQDGTVRIADKTSSLAGIGLWGPHARAILEQVADRSVANAEFPYFTAQALSVDAIPVYALRISYAGELGWELYCRTEYGLRLWDVLWQAGEDEGLIAAGLGAFSSLRLEKGYRAWGSDIHTEYNPYEAGLGWAVDLDKGDFIGREALLAAQQAGTRRRLCCLTLDNPGDLVLGKEPIMIQGQAAGYVTSTDYGYSVGRHIAYGYLPSEIALPGQKVSIIYFGREVPATVSSDPLFDATMSRLKA